MLKDEKNMDKELFATILVLITGRVAKLVNATDCQSVILIRFVGSSPTMILTRSHDPLNI